MLYANSITLTPGTITTGIKDDELEVPSLTWVDVDGREEDEMDRVILANAFRTLRPKGKLILTAPNAVHMLTQQSNVSFDPVTFRETFKLEKNRPDGRKKMLDCTQRYYTCPELNWLLRQTGFKSVEFFACKKAGYDRGAKPGKKDFELGAIAIK